MNRNIAAVLIGWSVILYCACSKTPSDPRTQIQFDCPKFIAAADERDPLAADARLAMREMIDQKTALVAYQWVCLKNGSIRTKDANYLKVSESGTDGRTHRRLHRLRVWASALLSDLSRRGRSEQIAILERISSSLVELIATEEKIFTEGLRQFKRDHLSLENLIIDYSLSDIHSSDLEITFRL